VSNEFKFTKPQTSQRLDSIPVRSDGIHPRTIPSSRRSAISINSITSSDGLSIGVLRGTKTKRKWEVAKAAGRLNMKLIKYHPICVLWFTALLTLGAVLQVVIK
jgi:hypothetical protein